MLLNLSGKEAKYELKLTLSIAKKRHYCGLEAIGNIPNRTKPTAN